MTAAFSTNPSWQTVRSAIYLRQFTAYCMPIWPVYALMFNERSGLSTAAISQLFFIWTAVTVLSELPTGVLADRYSRRWLLAAGTGLEGAAYAVWLTQPTYIGYAAGFVLWGIGYSMASGCLEAYLYDELEGLGEADRFTAIYSRANAMSSAGMVAGFSIAAVVGAQQYSLLLKLSIALAVVATAVAIRLPRESIRHHEEFVPGTSTLRRAIAEVRQSPRLMLLVGAGAVVGGLLGSVEEYVPIYYKVVGVPVAWIPHLLVVGLLLSTLLAWYAARFERFPAWFAAFILALGAAVLLIGTTGGVVVAAGAMLIFKRLIGLSLLLYRAALQHQIEGTARATVGSLPSFMAELVALAVFAGYGVITAADGDITAIRLVALACLIAALILLLWHRLVGSIGPSVPPPAQASE